MTRSNRRNRSIATTAVMLLCLTGPILPGFSQVGVNINGADPAPQENKDTPAGVSVPDSPGAALGLDRLVMLATGAPSIESIAWVPIR